MEYLQREKKSAKNASIGITVTFIMIAIPLVFGMLITYGPSGFKIFILPECIYLFLYAVTIASLFLYKPKKIPYDENAIYINEEKIPFLDILSITQKEEIKFYNSVKTRKHKCFITKTNNEKVYFTCPVDVCSYDFTKFKNTLKSANPNAKIILLDFKNRSTVL